MVILLDNHMMGLLKRNELYIRDYGGNYIIFEGEPIKIGNQYYIPVPKNWVEFNKGRKIRIAIWVVP